MRRPPLGLGEYGADGANMAGNAGGRDDTELGVIAPIAIESLPEFTRGALTIFRMHGHAPGHVGGRRGTAFDAIEGADPLIPDDIAGLKDIFEDADFGRIERKVQAARQANEFAPAFAQGHGRAGARRSAARPRGWDR